MRISDWSSDVCSSDLLLTAVVHPPAGIAAHRFDRLDAGEIAVARRRCELVFHPFRQRPRPLAVELGGRLEIDVSGQAAQQHRSSEERSVGKECVSKGRSRWSQNY